MVIILTTNFFIKYSVYIYNGYNDQKELLNSQFLSV